MKIKTNGQARELNLEPNYSNKGKLEECFKYEGRQLFLSDFISTKGLIKDWPLALPENTCGGILVTVLGSKVKVASYIA